MQAKLRKALVPAMSAAALLFAAAPSVGAQAPSAKLNDPTIVAIFDAANTWDMATGALAAKRGHTADVRSFGAMLVKAHRGVRQEGRDLAGKLKVTPTPPKNFGMAKDHAVAMRKLRALHGAAFDRAFLAHEVAYHKAVIDAVTTTLLPAIQNADLKKLVISVSPAFQAHMAQAQSMLDKYPK